jgi:subtilisin family serine protease
MTPTLSPDRIIARVHTWSAAAVERLAALIGGQIDTQIPSLRAVTFIIDPDRIGEVSTILSQHPDVKTVSRVAIGKELWTRDADAGNHITSRAAFFPYAQPHHILMNVIRAWKYTKGSASFPLAVADGAIKTSMNFLTGKTVYQWDTVNNVTSSGQADHGTIVSSVAVARENADGQAVIGIAPSADLMAIKTMNSASAIYIDKFIAAIDYAAAHGVKVLNSSIGFPPEDDPSGLMQEAIDNAYASGTVTVWAAGNTVGLQNGQLNYANCVVVGGCNSSEETHAFTHGDGDKFRGADYTYSPNVDLASAHVSFGIKMDGRSLLLGGTSFAAPAVAGVFQLVFAANPDLTAPQAIDCVLSTRRRANPLEQWMFDEFHSDEAGIADAEAAVIKAISLRPENAGQVFPYLRLHGKSERRVYGSLHPQYSTSGDVFEDWIDGGVVTTVGGNVGFQIDGFCSSGSVTEVELWINGEQEYIGPPTNTFSGSLYEREEYRNNLWELKVIARTGAGISGTQIYTTTGGATQYGELNSLDYTTFVPVWASVTASVASLSFNTTPPSVVALAQAAQAAHIQAASVGVVFTAAAPIVAALAATQGADVIRLPDGTPLSVKYWDGVQWAVAQLKLYPFL